MEPTDLPGLEAIEHCDVVLLFTRRVTIPKNQLDRIKAYVESGRPIVAVRTASHGFQDWLEFDKDVLGGNYQGHFGPESKQTVTKVPGKKDHPILKGVGKIRSKSVLYVTSPLSPDAELLMVGSIPQSSQPSAWTRIYKGGRIFYTALGSYDDFADPSFRQLLVNALFWATGRNQEKQ
ncbi:MAG: ThuA domain-containing protein [Terriglobia bacterium]